jgi:multiple antibiotic resistance protein
MRAVYSLPNITLGILLNLIIVYVVLRSSSKIEKLLGDSGLALVRKFFGIVLLSIAVRIFKTNF